MRNWNSRYPEENEKVWFGFQTTYEELKLSSNLYSVPSIMSGFQTTYEELKRSIASCFRVRVMASRLPMRNWNSERHLVGFRHLQGFQTTYEELKLPAPSVNSQILPQLPDYLWGIETTNASAISSRCHSFQTTYEELKPRDGSEVATCLDASRLPMRNWN